jgi:hypothetical protein
MLKKILFNFIFFISFSAGAKIPRLSVVYFNEGEVMKLVLAAGRPSVLLFPCPVVSFYTGTGGDMSAVANERNPKEIGLWLTSSAAEPASLIVRCESKTFVFDIIPSRTSSQDFVNIIASFGAPEMVESSKKIIASSETVVKNQLENKYIPKIKRIISKSENPQ